MLHNQRNDLGEEFDPAKIKNNKECIGHHYWIFNHEFKFQISACNVCHDLTLLGLNINDIAFIIVKGFDCPSSMHDISKSKAIHRLKNYVLDDCRYI